MILGSGAGGKLLAWGSISGLAVDAKSDGILGFTMFEAEAGGVMAALQTAMVAGLPYMSLRDTIFTHPTMAEGTGDLFARVPQA